MSQQSTVYVDAFAQRPFAGNAAAVCVLASARSENWMQRLAQETNLPATVFVTPAETDYAIRWFTPTQELLLCGHGTLAAAHTLWTEGHAPAGQPLRFQSKGGILTATRNGAWIRMDFPAIPTVAVAAPPQLLQGLGVAPRFVGKSSRGYLIEVASEAEARELTPDLSLWAQLDVANVIVTSRAFSEEFDFISRFFAPALGIAEDAATGSAHCCLAPYWAERLGKTEMIGYQASARGGVIQVGLKGDGVTLGGQAVIVLRGELSTAVGEA